MPGFFRKTLSFLGFIDEDEDEPTIRKARFRPKKNLITESISQKAKMSRIYIVTKIKVSILPDLPAILGLNLLKE